MTHSARTIPPDVPPEAVEFLEGMSYFAPDRLQVGAEAPDVPLLHPDGAACRSRALWESRPVVLIFGSYT